MRSLQAITGISFKMARVYIGLGSNLGDRIRNIIQAKKELFSSGFIKFIRESGMEETDPVDHLDQPRFMNQIILIETDIAPRQLLEFLLGVEIRLGRERNFSKGPRIIDLDILLYDDILITDEDLIIPHPEIKNREFILKHLVELNSELVDPITKIMYKELYSYGKNK